MLVSLLIFENLHLDESVSQSDGKRERSATLIYFINIHLITFTHHASLKALDVDDTFMTATLNIEEYEETITR